ncbi:MAG TPA: ABC transporter permease [Gemmatimonadaceae bacterium]|nr:ABC transporter permease [Gemmatimonadaceae bacterium]
MIHDLWQDIRHALRSMFHNLGFTATVVLVLALGIGANSTLFGIVDAVILRPLPYPESDRIVSISMANEDGNDVGRLDDPTAQLLAGSALRNFDAVALSNGTGANLTGGSAPERVAGARTSASFFEVMGVAPVVGRTFTADELRKGGPSAVIIGNGLWKRDFGGDPSVLGRAVQLDDRNYTVVGVMPEGYDYPNDAEYWLPLPPSEPMAGGGYMYVDVIGRLKSGVSVPGGVAELKSVRSRYAAELPSDLQSATLRAMTLHERAYGNLRPALLMLLGTVGCVLLIACANVANLLLARAAVRRREFALRTALGAARSRLVQQVLVESVLLALLGGAVGLALPLYGMPLLAAFGPDDLRSVPDIAVNGGVLVFTLAVSLGTGVLFGSAPAIALASGDVQIALRNGGTTLLGEGGRTGPRRVLVAAELALAVVLLTGAGLLVKSFINFRGVDPGFTAEGVLNATVTLPETRYESAVAQEQFFRELLSRVRAIPTVESAALSSITPLGGFNMIRRSDPNANSPIQLAVPQFAVSAVGTEYFDVFGIPVIAGREFAEQDDARAEPVVIISESMARAAFPGHRAVGEQLALGDDESYTVVGVVADVRQRPAQAVPLPMVYRPRLQAGSSTYGHISLRTRDGTDPLTLVPALRAALRAVDATQPLSHITTMEALLSESIAPRRFNVLLLGSFAALACVLAAVGLYGVIAFLVAQRTREIGLRMALGAEARQIVLAVLRQGLRVAAAGVVVGITASLVLSRIVEGMLFGITRHDPMVFVAVPLLLLGVAALAIVIPARRASRVDPVIALRAE